MGLLPAGAVVLATGFAFASAANFPRTTGSCGGKDGTAVVGLAVAEVISGRDEDNGGASSVLEERVLTIESTSGCIGEIAVGSLGDTIWAGRLSSVCVPTPGFCATGSGSVICAADGGRLADIPPPYVDTTGWGGLRGGFVSS